MPIALETFRALARHHTRIPVSREVPSDLETPLAAYWKLAAGEDWSFFLESVEGGEKWGRYTYMGAEPRAIYRARGGRLEITRPGQPDQVVDGRSPLDEVLARAVRGRTWQDPELPRFVGGLVGALAYDAVRWFEHLPAPAAHADVAGPDLVLMETGLVLVWDNLRQRALLVTLAEVTPGASPDLAYARAVRELDHAEARLLGPLPPLPPGGAAPGPVEAVVDDAHFAAAVREAKALVAAGDIIQVVLSRRFTCEAGGLHPFNVYRVLRGLNPSPYMFYLRLGPTTLVGASPEVLVRATDGLLETRPIAGTRPRGADPAGDLALEMELRSDPKERAEHVMLVDLARNDLGRVSEIGSVRVLQEAVVERYSHVMHLVSHVEGRLRPAVSPHEVLAATFPAGTLSGAPKIRAMQIIDTLETERRGFYGGSVGVIGVDGNLDLAIAIRTLVAEQGRFDVRAGAGIVYDSVPELEAEESRHKAQAVLRAIQIAHQRFGGAP
jgi:anthranilate synthase component 1